MNEDAYKSNASKSHNEYIKKNKRYNNQLNKDNDVYVIDNGFPGPIDEGKAIVRLSYNTVYAISGM